MIHSKSVSVYNTRFQASLRLGSRIKHPFFQNIFICTVGKNPPDYARDTILIPGKIPHAMEQQSPWTTTTEPPCYNY